MEVFLHVTTIVLVFKLKRYMLYTAVTLPFHPLRLLKNFCIQSSALGDHWKLLENQSDVPIVPESPYF